MTNTDTYIAELTKLMWATRNQAQDLGLLAERFLVLRGELRPDQRLFFSAKERAEAKGIDTGRQRV